MSMKKGDARKVRAILFGVAGIITILSLFLVGALQSIIVFTNNQANEDIYFTNANDISRYLSIPKNANVTSAFLNLSGASIPKNITNCTDLQNINDTQGYYQLQNDIDCSASRTWNSGKGFLPILTVLS